MFLHLQLHLTSSTLTLFEHCQGQQQSLAEWISRFGSSSGLHHFFTAFSKSVVLGYGADEQDKRLAQLPFIRLLCDGATCVNIFFVVSGYVCSLSALKAMSKQDPDKATRGLITSIFRRYLRLYLPVAFVSLIVTLIAYVGAFETLRPMVEDSRQYFPGVFSEIQVASLPTVTAQLKYWATEFARLSNPWTITAYYPQHDPHLWTIQYEFRMSLNLYISLVGLAKCTSVARLFLLCLLGMAHLFWGLWEGPLFFFGAALAQYDIIRQTRNDASGLLPSAEQKRPVSRHHRWVRSIVYIICMYLISFPIAGHKKPSLGYVWMNDYLIPRWYQRKEKFPKSLGVFGLTYLLTTSSNHMQSQTPSIWHRALESTIALNLGK